MAEATVDIKDANNAAMIPVDGIAVTTAAGNPTAGEAIRQAMTLGDGTDSPTYARVQTQAPLPTDPALTTRGYSTLEDVCIFLHGILAAITQSTSINPGSGQVRVELDSIASAATLANVSAVGSVFNVNNVVAMAGVNPVFTGLFDQMNSAWGQCVRARIN